MGAPSEPTRAWCWRTAREGMAMCMRVAELVPFKRVEWEIISTHPPESPASAWTGTRISFDLEERRSGHWMGMHNGGMPMCVVNFQHAGWDTRQPVLWVLQLRLGRHPRHVAAVVRVAAVKG